MTTYLLNTPVLTSYGEWSFEGPITTEQAHAAIASGFVSAIGHEGSAEFLSLQLGVDVPVNRIRAELAPGDRAIVLRLNGRLPVQGELSHEQMKQLPFELGLLCRKS